MALENYIPRRLQERKFLFWHQNELLVFFGSVGMGLFLEKELLGVIFGIIFMKLLKRTNKSGRDGYLLSLIYWYLPPFVSGLKKTPPSYKRNFLG